MDDINLGIITVLLCIAGYSFAWKYQSKDKYTIAISLLIISGLILRIYTSADFFLHSWDEMYHALVAKNLIKHPLLPTLYDNPVLPYDFKAWVQNHVWLHKQPLPLWTMALSMKMFGVNEIALRLPSILLSTAGIFFTYYIGKYFFDRKIGFLAAFFFSINGLIIEMMAGRVASDHPDTFFLFFVEAAIFFSILFIEKKNMIFNLLAGIFIGAAILSKWLPALIVLPIWGILAYSSGKFSLKYIAMQFVVLTTVCAAVFLPWQIYIFNAFPLEAKWESDFNFRHINEVIEGQVGPWHYYLDKIRISFNELIYLPLLWYIWKVYKNIHVWKSLALLIWILIPLIFFSFVATKMQGYILFTAPALFIITADFYDALVSYRKNQKHKWFITLVLLILIALPVRYSIERIKPFENTDRHPQWVRDLKALNINDEKNTILFNYDHPIEAMFYTDMTVYKELPEINILYELKEKGYKVLINDVGDIPQEIRDNFLDQTEQFPY